MWLVHAEGRCGMAEQGYPNGWLLIPGEYSFGMIWKEIYCYDERRKPSDDRPEAWHF